MEITTEKEHLNEYIILWESGADPGGGGVLGVRTPPFGGAPLLRDPPPPFGGPPHFGGPPNFKKRDKNVARMRPNTLRFST